MKGVAAARRIGVLALQGDFAAHEAMVAAAGAIASGVRRPSELDGLDGLVIPGGESTALSILLDHDDLRGAIERFASAGGALFGTCAGVILLAQDVVAAERVPVRTFGLLDITVSRNGYGRQCDSFEAVTAIPALVDDAFPLAFIRAPRITRVGPGVDVLATFGGDPVLVRQGRMLGATFHPEIYGDARLHAYFARAVCARPELGGRAPSRAPRRAPAGVARA